MIFFRGNESLSKRIYSPRRGIIINSSRPTIRAILSEKIPAALIIVLAFIFLPSAEWISKTSFSLSLFIFFMKTTSNSKRRSIPFIMACSASAIVNSNGIIIPALGKCKIVITLSFNCGSIS